MQCGPRSEKLDPDQLNLAFEDIEQAIAADEAREERKNPAAAMARVEKRRVNRGVLPVQLPRVHVTIAAEDINFPCRRTPMHVIGEDSSERLDVIPAQFRVIVTHRPKYSCRACEEAVVQAPTPERPIRGGPPTEAMVASVLVAKYAWHLPLYRQSRMLFAQGLDIKRSILAFWVGHAAAELKPIYVRLRELILVSGKIAVDETIAPVLDPGRGRTNKGYFWAIARDDRPLGRDRSACHRLQLRARARRGSRAQAARRLSWRRPSLAMSKNWQRRCAQHEIERILREKRPDAEIQVVSNPEFLREGAAIQDFKHPDRIVVGTDDARARGVLADIYRPLSLNAPPIIYVSRRTAELIKYAANAFLATKITFINEIADLCEQVGADVQDVARGMGLDKRIGSKFLHAGPGFGGSCFPKDTTALLKTAQDNGVTLRIVEAVAAVNELRKRAMARRVLTALDGSVRGRTVAVLGLTFKPNTDDTRESPRSR